MFSLYSFVRQPKDNTPFKLIDTGPRGKLGPLMNTSPRRDGSGQVVRYALYRGNRFVRATG